MRLLRSLSRSITFWWHLIHTVMAFVGLVGNVVLEQKKLGRRAQVCTCGSKLCPDCDYIQHAS